MLASSVLHTPSSLLERLRLGNEPEAWSRFVYLYTPLLFRYARGRGLDVQAAEEIVQDVFAHLVIELRRFQYNRTKGKFHKWLWKVFINRWRQGGRGWDPVRDAERTGLADIADNTKAFGLSEKEYDEYLRQRIVEQIKGEFATQTWEAFRLVVLEHCSPQEVAAKLNLSVDSVYQAKRRVLRKLKLELDGLTD